MRGHNIAGKLSLGYNKYCTHCHQNNPSEINTTMCHIYPKYQTIEAFLQRVGPYQFTMDLSDLVRLDFSYAAV